MYVDDTADPSTSPDSTAPTTDPTVDPTAVPTAVPTGAVPMAQPVPTAGGQWTVEPDQVNAFAQAVAQVRANLDKVHGQVDELSGPDYQPRLGTSPTGKQLAEKFSDRLTSDSGLRGQLNIALKNLDDFVSSAEKAASTYRETDQASADSLRRKS